MVYVRARSNWLAYERKTSGKIKKRKGSPFKQNVDFQAYACRLHVCKRTHLGNVLVLLLVLFVCVLLIYFQSLAFLYFDVCVCSAQPAATTFVIEEKCIRRSV